MDGGGTVNVTPLLARLLTVTTTRPVAAPEGTGTWILVLLQLAGEAVTPLNRTVLVPWVAPNRAPLIVTVVPTGPVLGVRLVMFGGRGCGTTTVES